MTGRAAKQPDWNALCNHPGIIFVQRIVLTVSVALGVPAVVWMAGTFLEMRDAMRDAQSAMTRTEKVLEDHEKRLRAVEHYGPSTPGRR